MPGHEKFFSGGAVTRSFLLAAVCLVSGLRPAAAQCAHPLDAPVARAGLRVSPAELHRRRAEPDLVVLHAGMSAAEYRAGHVPGARWVNVMAFVEDRPDLSHEVPAIARLDSLIEAAGVRDGDRVVLYGDVAHLGRIFLALEVAGLADRVAVLDGGLAAWRAAGLPVSTTAPPPRGGTFTPRPRPDLVVDAEWLRSRAGTRRVALLDARSAAEFAGTAREHLPRVGHLPGARHLDWTRTFARGGPTADGDGLAGGGQLLPMAELQRLFRDAGVQPGQSVVLYCTIGMRAAHLYYVARYLGYDARLYDGSMEDWSRRRDLPITQGERP